MSRIAASVAIVATDGVGGRAGATVNTLSPVSAEQPPSLLICLQRTTSACRAVRANGSFSINSLSKDQRELARVFAASASQGQKNSDSDNKFEHGEWIRNKNDVWLLKGALASFDCLVKETLVWQSHEVILGEVRSITLNAQATPLLYANRRYKMLGDNIEDSKNEESRE